MTIKITTTDPESGETLILAEGELDITVTETDTGYYFEPVAVNTEILVESPDESKQDEIGLGKYFDVVELVSRDVIRTMVAWVYAEVQPEYDEIAGLYGFSKVDAAGVMVEVTDEEGNELQDRLEDEDILGSV